MSDDKKSRVDLYDRLKFFSLSNPIKSGEIEKAYEEGMIKKSDLVDGKFYFGNCRNAYFAMWNAEFELFIYLRDKFGSSFLETICHPEDDDGFDIFTPQEISEPSEKYKNEFYEKLPQFIKWIRKSFEMSDS